ncbi:platelet endothelial aggregation receptor 1-like [Phlebotomus argentipes]|uniref:platelet endothelial aggregation receptor 1-like n=1 Tax=Phlebotomus argentipes TaxID=94469 RepID=UPI0028930225|nr:platelet endothelial aggregation receptor 1-like [Phlebotomus argentipes]
MHKGDLVKLILVLCTVSPLGTAQYCNRDIKVCDVQKETIDYVTRESYQDKCPFLTEYKACVFWRNVTKQKTEEKIVHKVETIVTCCPGYSLFADKCIPHCEDPCINGVCTAPGVCHCNSGYAKSTEKDHICHPVCSDCVNGQCVAPESCECYSGYAKNFNSSVCEPFCGDSDCGSGICREPFNCQCHPGFEKDDQGICTVQSCQEDCKGGRCANGECECPSGASWDLNESACVCTSPSDDFTVSTSNSNDYEYTEMIPGDENAANFIIATLVAIIILLATTIISILVIVWYKNWKSESQNVHFSHFSGICGSAAEMVAKGKIVVLLVLIGTIFECSAKWCKVTELDYVLKDVTVDVTKYKQRRIWPCLKNCFKTVPYTVQETQHKWVAQNVTKEVCCEGYSEEIGQCIAICAPSCKNARCVAPNSCKCNFGYESRSENECVPHCENCEFGTCKAPFLCVCDSGYQREVLNEGEKCVPVCKDGCPSGSFCSQPNICTCKDNFTEISVAGQKRCIIEGETDSTTLSTQITEKVTEEITEDSTDYAEIEEIPEEDFENVTFSEQLDEADVDVSLEIVSDDPWKNFPLNSNAYDEIVDDKADQMEEKVLHSVLGRLWYFVMAVAVIICAIIAVKYYIAIQQREFKIPHDIPTDVAFTAKA